MAALRISHLFGRIPARVFSVLRPCEDNASYHNNITTWNRRQEKRNCFSCRQAIVRMPVDFLGIQNVTKRIVGGTKGVRSLQAFNNPTVTWRVLLRLVIIRVRLRCSVCPWIVWIARAIRRIRAL